VHAAINVIGRRIDSARSRLERRPQRLDQLRDRRFEDQTVIDTFESLGVAITALTQATTTETA
jgi:hypothetical protein